MEVTILSTPAETRSAVETLLTGSDSVRIAAAFVRLSGVEELGLARRALSKLQVLAGTDFRLTQVEALEALNSPPDRECRLFFTSEDNEGVFHPKLYFGQAGSDFIAVVGSSNLTRPAFTKNEELNVLLTGRTEHTLVNQLDAYFQRVWNASPILDKALIEAYRVDQAVRERFQRQMQRSPEYQRVQQLVQSALVGHLTSRPGQRWLLITSEENYVRCRGRGRWGDESYKRIRQIQPGDLLIFYIKGIHKLGAVAVARTPVYRSSENTWIDREYPFRVDFVVLIDPPAPVDFRPFISMMRFLPRKDAKWGTALQTSSLELPEYDAQILIDAIGAATAIPEPQLQVAEKPEQYGTT